MKKLSVSTFAFLCAILSLPASLQAGPPATVDQLDWMTGNWAGQLGPNQLEELDCHRRWFDRCHGANDGRGATSMFEMITIEEVDGSLMLNIQQWDPGLSPALNLHRPWSWKKLPPTALNFEL